MKVVTQNSNLVNEITVVDTTNVNITLQMPRATFAERNFKVIKIGAGSLVINCGDKTLIDASTSKTITDSNVIIDLVYQNTTDNVNIISLVSGVPGGGGGDTGWTLDASVTYLNDSLGLGVENYATTTEFAEYMCIVDTSSGDVTEDLTSAETTYPNIFKFIKVAGVSNLILQSTQGFDIGGNELLVSDFCILFNDTVGPVWQVLYNTEYKTKVVDISSAEILAMGTTPIELLPTPGVGKYYEIENIILEYTHVSSPYSTFASLAFLLGTNPLFYIDGMITVSSNSFKKGTDTQFLANLLNTALNLSTADSSDPTLGDGTLRVIIKYKTRTFGA